MTELELVKHRLEQINQNIEKLFQMEQAAEESLGSQ